MRLSPPPSLPFGRCLSMAPICASTRCLTLPRGGALLSLLSPVWSGSTVRSQMSWRDKVGALVRCIATVVPLRSADGRVTLIRVELAEVPAALPCSGIRRAPPPPTALDLAALPPKTSLLAETVRGPRAARSAPTAARPH